MVAFDTIPRSRRDRRTVHARSHAGSKTAFRGDEMQTGHSIYQESVMRKSVAESAVHFLSIIKWVFLATIAGAIVVVAVSLFLKSLTWRIGLTSAALVFSGFFFVQRTKRVVSVLRPCVELRLMRLRKFAFEDCHN